MLHGLFHEERILLPFIVTIELYLKKKRKEKMVTKLNTIFSDTFQYLFFSRPL